MADPLHDDLLQDAAATFGMLATEVGQSVAAVSQHLAKLKLAGLVRARRDGRRQVYVADDPHVVEMVRKAVEHHAELREEPRRRA